MFARGLQQDDRAALLSATLLWVFGYLLVTALVLASRGVAGFPSTLAEAPVFALAAVAAFGLYAVMRAVRPLPFWARLLLAGVLTAAAAAALAAVNVAVASWAGEIAAAAGERPISLGPNAFSSRFFGYFWAFSLNASIFWGHIATAKARAQAVALAAAETAAMRAQLAALRFQLNPHFLFNSLNALSSMVMEAGAKDAEAMIAKLCAFLRAALAADPNAVVTLEEELETAQAYLEIEAVRFGERLGVEFDCGPGVREALVPNFLLQPLVENAIKHAVAPAKRPVLISVTARREGDDLRITVQDDGDAPPAVSARLGGGLGLRNVADRLSVAYGSRGVLRAARGGAGFRADVLLPFRSALQAERDAA